MISRLLPVMMMMALTCCSIKPLTLKAPFDQKASAHILKSGDRLIFGQAFAREESGGVVRAAGSRVLLLPDTKIHEEYADALMHYRQVKLPNRMRKYRQETIADADGKFAFNDLAPGKYLLISKVEWTDKEKLNHKYFLFSAADITKKKTARVILLPVQ